jgi:hypothetical protein
MALSDWYEGMIIFLKREPSHIILQHAAATM